MQNSGLPARRQWRWLLITTITGLAFVLPFLVVAPADARRPVASTTTTTAPTATAPSTTTPASTTSTSVSTSPTTAPPTGAGAAPATPPAQICRSQVLSGPATQPAGSVRVDPSANLYDATSAQPAGSTFWLAPGTHSLGATEFSQVVPKDGNTYIGAPGAVIDGQNLNRYAFTGRAANVKIRYLTIQNFGAVGGNNNEGVVNHDAGSGWTVEYSTIQGNAGAGMFLGTGNTVRYNCLLNNGQYGFSMYVPPPAGGANAITNITLDHNEIAGNNTYDWESKISGCGCTGGGKFWDVGGARVTNNWVHHNKSVGLWADTNDVDFLVEGNYIEENDSMGFFYEISYNAVVRNNTFKRNAIKAGLAAQARGDNFPQGAVYLSEAGGDTRVTSTVTGTTNLEITGNSFVDNWDGVVLWESADRFFNSPANTSGTWYVPKGGVASTTTCNDPAVGGSINTDPAYTDCRWKTKNVKVSANTFAFDPAAVGCTSGFCGRNAQFSQYGSYPAWSPYKAWAVADAITFNQGNSWSGNTYTGAWKFMPHDTGRTVTPSAWQAAPYNQDTGSTFNSGGTTTPTTQPAPSPTTTAPASTPTTVPASGDLVAGDTATFEGSVGSWAPWFSAAVARSTLQAHGGSASARVDITAPYGWGLQLNNWPGFAAAPGPKTIGFSGLLGAGTNLGATMTVRWRNDAGTDLQTDQVTISTLSTTWQQAVAQVTAPTGTTRITVELSSSSGRRGDQLYVDDLRITSGTNALDADAADFEGSLGTWVPWFSAGMARSSMQAESGLSSARVDVKASYGWGVQLSNWPGFAAHPGAYALGFSALLGSGSNIGATLTVRWRNDAGRELQTDHVTIPTLARIWQRASAEVTAPAGTTRAGVELTHASGQFGDAIYVDQIYLG